MTIKVYDNSFADFFFFRRFFGSAWTKVICGYFSQRLIDFVTVFGYLISIHIHFRLLQEQNSVSVFVRERTYSMSSA